MQMMCSLVTLFLAALSFTAQECGVYFTVRGRAPHHEIRTGL